MKEDTSTSITYYGANKKPISEEFSLPLLTRYIQAFYGEEKGGLKMIFGDFDIHPSVSQEELDKKKIRQNKYNINKALAFELIITHWLRQSDNPKEARANCELNEGDNPSNYAPVGHADAWLNYGNFTLSVEVSAKKSVGSEDFKEQVKGLLRHRGDAKFSLLITNRPLSYKNTLDLYNNALKKAEEENPEQKRSNIIILSTEELLEISKLILGKTRGVPSETPDAAEMEKVFEAVSSKIDNAVQDGEIAEDLLVNAWKNALYPTKPKLKQDPTKEDPPPSPSPSGM